MINQIALVEPLREKMEDRLKCESCELKWVPSEDRLAHVRVISGLASVAINEMIHG